MLILKVFFPRLGPLPHQRSDRARLSAFQTDRIWPSIFLYEQSDINELMSVYSWLTPIWSDKNKQMEDPLSSICPDCRGQSGVNRQSVIAVGCVHVCISVADMDLSSACSAQLSRESADEFPAAKNWSSPCERGLTARLYDQKFVDIWLSHLCEINGKFYPHPTVAT